MKKPPQVGLVVEGSNASSSLLEFPHLLEEIGPIKSSSLRNARRFANSLKAGRAVASYKELSEARLILLCAPDAVVEQLVSEIIVSSAPFKGASFIAWSTWLPSSSLAELRSVGASVATLLRVPGTGFPVNFICEGDSVACRHVRRHLCAAGAQIFHVATDTKAFYFGAEMLVTAVPLPALWAAQLCLRRAGISGHALSSFLNHMTTRLVRNSRSANRAKGVGTLHSCSPETARAYLSTLAAAMPDAHKMIEAALAARHFGAPTKLVP